MAAMQGHCNAEGNGTLVGGVLPSTTPGLVRDRPELSRRCVDGEKKRRSPQRIEMQINTEERRLELGNLDGPA